jgi:hypothetical protein
MLLGIVCGFYISKAFPKEVNLFWGTILRSTYQALDIAEQSIHSIKKSVEK